MANDLTTTAPPRSMAPFTPSLERLVSTMSPDYPPVIATALTSDEREQVRDMLAACDRSTARATRREIAGIVMQVLANYPSDGASRAIEDARAKNWIDALEDLPVWAIEAARLRWLRGEVDGVNPDFAPKPARFREIVIACMAPIYERKSVLRKLLVAVPDDRGEISEEARARGAEILQACADEIRAGADARFPGREPEAFVPPEERAARALKHATEAAADFRANPPALSDVMRRKLEAEGRLVQRAEDAA